MCIKVLEANLKLRFSIRMFERTWIESSNLFQEGSLCLMKKELVSQIWWTKFLKLKLWSREVWKTCIALLKMKKCVNQKGYIDPKRFHFKKWFKGKQKRANLPILEIAQQTLSWLRKSLGSNLMWLLSWFRSKTKNHLSCFSMTRQMWNWLKKHELRTSIFIFY